MNVKHSENCVRAKERNRSQSPPPDYFNAPDYTKAVRRLVYEDFLTGAKHEFLLFISPRRVDQFRVEINGKLWKERIGWTHVLAGLRKATGRFGRMP